jgi:hypothetical protein
MQAVDESKKQVDELGPLLKDMEDYLDKFEQGCLQLPIQFHADNKSQPLEILTQIMEGLSYYQKLLKSAAILLSIDFSEILCEKMSVSSLLDQLCQNFTSILEAAQNEDYSLLTDIIEYDLLSDIYIAKGMLAKVQRRYEERII